MKFQCALCRANYPTSALIWCCEKCGGQLDAVELPDFRRGDIATGSRSLWRYQKALVHQGPVTISLGEGWTPLVARPWGHTPTLWKCEFVSISGSFKDRGVAVMINQ